MEQGKSPFRDHTMYIVVLQVLATTHREWIHYSKQHQNAIQESMQYSLNTPSSKKMKQQHHILWHTPSFFPTNAVKARNKAPGGNVSEDPNAK